MTRELLRGLLALILALGFTACSTDDEDCADAEKICTPGHTKVDGECYENADVNADGTVGEDAESHADALVCPAAPAGGEAAGGEAAPAGGDDTPAGGEDAPAGGDDTPAGGEVAGGEPAAGGMSMDPNVGVACSSGDGLPGH